MRKYKKQKIWISFSLKSFSVKIKEIHQKISHNKSAWHLGKTSDTLRQTWMVSWPTWKNREVCLTLIALFNLEAENTCLWVWLIDRRAINCVTFRDDFKFLPMTRTLLSHPRDKHWGVFGCIPFRARSQMSAPFSNVKDTSWACSRTVSTIHSTPPTPLGFDKCSK